MSNELKGLNNFNLLIIRLYVCGGGGGDEALSGGIR
jgi:hypothetical protein